MSECITTDGRLTIGLDLGDRFTERRLLNASAEVIEAFRVRTIEPALSSRSVSFSPSRVVLEAGTTLALRESLGLEVGSRGGCGEPASASADLAERLEERRSRCGTPGPTGPGGPLAAGPIVHPGEQAQQDRILIQARDGFVRARMQLVNQVRDFANALRNRVPSNSTPAFPKRVRAALPRDLFPGLETLLDTIDQLTATIRRKA